MLSDIYMGNGPTGWDVGRKAREINPQMPVVYMSGEHGDEWASRGVPGSVMLGKPFAIAQLITALSQLINAVPPTAAT